LVHSSISNILYRIDTDSLHRIKTPFLGANEIGRIELETSEPLFFDTYKINRSTGRFILVNPRTNKTAAVGMIRGIKRRVDDIAQIKYATSKKSPNVVWEDGIVDRISWEKRNRHKAFVLWFTGLSGSGKSTIARGVLHNLFHKGRQIILLDGDNVRHGLCGDLGFSGRDRSENIRRVGETAKLFFEQGNIVLCTFISPFLEDRHFVRSILPENHFIEVFIDCSIDECKSRDPKGLYKKAQAGEIKEFTGISSPYEKPLDPEVTLRTDQLSIKECVQKIISYINKI
jgi:bifunctional enzyme CysN/CysC